MEILNTLGITEKQLRKISPETATSLAELDTLSAFVESDAPFNIKEEFARLSVELERFLASDEFARLSKKAGVNLRTSEITDISEVEIEEAPKVKKSLREIAKEKREAKKQAPQEPVIEAEPIVDVEPEEEAVIEQKPEEPTAVPQVDVEGELPIYSIRYKSKASASTLKSTYEISALCSYGGTDYNLFENEQIEKVTYRLNLPKSEADIFFEFPNIESNASMRNLDDIINKYYSSRDASLYLIGKNEQEIDALSLILTTSQFSDIDIIEQDEIKSSESFKNENFLEIINDEYNKDFLGNTFLDAIKPIKQTWTAESIFKGEWSNKVDENDYSTQFIVPNVRFGDYVYKSKEQLYKRGGVSIVTNRLTLYSPSGLSKYQQFAEIGTHIEKDDNSSLSLKKFEKDASLGKTFQALSGKTEKAVESRIVGSSDDKYLCISNQGDTFLIDKMAFNYFKKYYSMSDLVIKLSDSIAIVFYNESVVGMIRVDEKSIQGIVGVINEMDVETELMNLNPNAYQFMVSAQELGEQQEEKEIVEIEQKDAP
ncbi:MAG: hypothetical protein ACW99Q_20915, partial [Candidatus Kariarchaeaceae archaeon]